MADTELRVFRQPSRLLYAAGFTIGAATIATIGIAALLSPVI